MKSDFKQPHYAYAGGKHQNGNQNGGYTKGVVHQPMCHFIPPAAEPIGCRVRVAGDVLLVFCTRENMRDEGNEDGQREDGKHSSPHETHVVSVFPAFLGGNIFLVRDVRPEPFQGAIPRRLLLRLPPSCGFARRFVLFYAFLCVHCLVYIIIYAKCGHKVTI